ncbi:MAG TPA: hypothetical protein VGQ73_08625 [Gemmatimonadales bacterium]|jgi:hypothetical protein|nr:hypothetical protein [Gemmatimonadales bacterium]
MTSAVAVEGSPDQTDLPHILRSGVKLGLLQCGLIAAFALLQRYLDGPAELVLCGIILVVGLALTIVLPGQWTRARTIEGIAGAAGIGFAAAIVFLLIDVAIFQPVHLYGNRWLEIGGGSNWWYHPVWWMVGTFVPWMGAWIQANQTARNGQPSPIVLVLESFLLALFFLGLAIMVHLPNAAWGLGGFAVAVLPALALLTALTSFGARRR